MRSETHSRSRTSIGLTVSRTFLSFLSMVFLFSFLILLSLYLTLFSGSYLNKQAEGADYYANLTEEINKQIENTALGSNIPVGVLSDAVTEAQVKEDVSAYFTAMYDKEEEFAITNEQAVRDSVIAKVNQYAATNNIDVTEETQNAIQLLADRSVELYDGYVELPFLLSFANRVIGYKSKLILFMAVCGGLCVVLSLILFSSLRGYVHRLFRYWGFIFAGGGLMMIGMPVVILISGVLKRLGIQSKAMYTFVQTYLASFLWLFIIIGIIALVLGIFFAVLSENQRKRMFRQ